jgi:hypothetical protein
MTIPLNIQEVKHKGQPLVRATDAEVDALEQHFACSFPPGYRTYITALGEGVLGGTFVRVYPPWRILTTYTQWRTLLAEHWYWEKDLPAQRAVAEAILIADTWGGDLMLFYPTAITHLVVLPNSKTKTYWLEPDLLCAIEWLCSSGRLVRPFKSRNFEPFDSRLW